MRYAAVLMLWIALTAYAASAQSQEPLFKAASNLQTLAVQVTDKHDGNTVHGLTASDFTVLEDKRPQKIAFFGTEDQPISLAILLDSSASMESSKKLERAKAILGPLVSAARPQDEIFVIPFTDQIGTFVTLSPNRPLNAPLGRLSSDHGGTALYDATATALCHLRSATNLRQAIVVITDGADQHSRLRIEQLIHLARSSNPQIFMIGFWGKEESDFYRESAKTVALANGREIDNPVQVFERIARESGAESFFPESERDLTKVLARIHGILRAEYTLAYYPENIDKFRRIQVKVHRSGVVVTVRHTVSSEAAEGESVHFVATSCTVSPQEHPYPWEPLITQAPSGKVTYKEDFSNPQTGWPNRPVSRYVSGGYEISHTPTKEDANLPAHWVEGSISAYGPWWGDFRASLSLEDRGTGEEGQGMVFRLNGVGFYVVLLTRVGKPACSFKLVKTLWPPSFSTYPLSHWATVIVPWTACPSDRTPEQRPSKKITVECKGSQITVWIDDSQVAQIKDYNFEAGYVGMAQFGYGRTIFRDLQIQSLP